MMLIGKTANWLLRHSVQRCVKNRRLEIISVSCLSLDSRAPRLQDVSLSTFQLARDLRNLSHLDSHW